VLPLNDRVIRDSGSRGDTCAGGGCGGAQHDTEGWKCLETSFKALQCLIEGTGEAIAAHLGAGERALIYRALQHPNRFVRETGFLTMGSLCGILRGANLLPQLDEMALWLGKGMGDNWSQVRFAASVATRAFLEGMEEEAMHAVFPVLLPRMCLNRCVRPCSLALPFPPTRAHTHPRGFLARLVRCVSRRLTPARPRLEVCNTHLSKVNTHLSKVNTHLSKVNIHLSKVNTH
jgi:hypothetical protein